LLLRATSFEVVYDIKDLFQNITFPIL
jgi:hypothetical protein